MDLEPKGLCTPRCLNASTACFFPTEQFAVVCIDTHARYHRVCIAIETRV